VESKRGAYRRRPWLPLYRPGTSFDLPVEIPDALSMWRASVAQAGHRPLIHYFGQTLTFAEVDSDSDALAVALAGRGIASGDRIALFLQNVPQFVVGLIATWKLGCIAVPVNPMLKQRELSYVLADSGARSLICLQQLWNSVAASAVQASEVTVAVTTSPLDGVPAGCQPPLPSMATEQTPGAVDFAEMVRLHSGLRPEPVTLLSETVALLTYTSGTTGAPKGAMNTHGNIVFNAHAYCDWIGLTETDVCLAAAPLFHITGLIGHIAAAILARMPMVLGYRFDAPAMIELAERHRITYTVMAITAYSAILNDVAASARDLSSWTKAYSCGSPIPVSILERFEKEIGPYIHNVYGLTETTAPSHAVPYGLRAPVDHTTGALSIGVPIFNYVARIIDDEGDDLPIGAPGEIAISGPGVVPGYWNRPTETAETMPGGEIRTGDIGLMNEQGWFFLIDRKKDLINASGFKVWPREVEDTLLAHSAVREAIVVGVPDQYRGETVKAFVSLQPDIAAAPEELIDFCKDRLASYKYPRMIEIMDELPKTATGKLLRRELRGNAVPTDGWR
jgi:long-chain acyl-CoA synthetase